MMRPTPHRIRAATFRRAAQVLALCVCAMGLGRAETPRPAPAEVEAKIAALGQPYRPDDVPFGWLLQRREQVIPELIDGLASRRREVASGCLRILDRGAPRPEIREALLAIARNHRHHLSLSATCSLRHYAEDARARALLDAAYADEARLKSPYQRALVALGLGRTREAAQLLLRLLPDGKGIVATSEVIKQLGKIGATTAVPGPREALETLLKDPGRQNPFAETRLALADAAPEEYPLTEGQRAFLTEATRRWERTAAEKKQKWAELARLDREELRPFVMRVLSTYYPGPALGILRLWKDRAVLPELERLIAAGKNLRAHAPVYLEIADTDWTPSRAASASLPRQYATCSRGGDAPRTSAARPTAGACSRSWTPPTRGASWTQSWSGASNGTRRLGTKSR